MTKSRFVEHGIEGVGFTFEILPGKDVESTFRCMAQEWGGKEQNNSKQGERTDRREEGESFFADDIFSLWLLSNYFESVIRLKRKKKKNLHYLIYSFPSTLHGYLNCDKRKFFLSKETCVPARVTFFFSSSNREKGEETPITPLAQISDRTGRYLMRPGRPQVRDYVSSCWNSTGFSSDVRADFSAV